MFVTLCQGYFICAQKYLAWLPDDCTDAILQQLNMCLDSCLISTRPIIWCRIMSRMYVRRTLLTFASFNSFPALIRRFILLYTCQFVSLPHVEIRKLVNKNFSSCIKCVQTIFQQKWRMKKKNEKISKIANLWTRFEFIT